MAKGSTNLPKTIKETETKNMKWGGRGRWIMRSRDRDHLGQHGETLSLLKIQKISWAWWRVSVIPATREAEAGELPELRRRRLRWAKIVPLYSSLGNKSETPSEKKIIQKISQASMACPWSPNYSGGWGTRIPWTREVEAVVSRDCATSLHPGQQSKTLSPKK